MNIKKRYLFAILSFALFSCERYSDKEYELPINTIENIKLKNSFGNVILTMEKYYAKDQEILASFIFKEKKASIKLKFNSSESRMKFINIGSESDYFLIAISDLFEEELVSPEIKDFTIFSFVKKGDHSEIDLFDKENEYVLFYKPNLDEKGSVQLKMKIDMEKGIVAFWEKNRGIAKRNLVKAFEK